MVSDTTKEFFELELAKKLEFTRDEKYHGYVRLCEERFVFHAFFAYCRMPGQHRHKK